jgi:hypothetical protein
MFTLTSSAFSNEGEIPSRHTCDGPDLSPPLAWRGTPPAARSLALVVVDPDAPDPRAPRQTWTHWILYNLPADCTRLPEGVSPAEVPAGTLSGTTDFGRTGWGGPCPPIGCHRYYFRLHALTEPLPDLHEPTRQQLEQAIGDKVLATAELLGTYRKRY